MQTFKLTDKQEQLRRKFSEKFRYYLVYGGSRSGKSFYICHAIITRALKASVSRHVIFRNDGIDAKQSLGNETIPAVIRLAYPDLSVVWRDKDGYFELPNKSQIWLAGLKDKQRLDKVLGKEYATIYLNECSQISYEAFQLVKSRLAQTVKQLDGRELRQVLYADLNPTTEAHWTYQVFVKGIEPDTQMSVPDHEADYCHLIANPMDNAENLSDEYLKSLKNMPERMRRRFFDGLYTADDDNALWRRDYIQVDEPPQLERIVVAIDPAISNNIGSDETGIIVAGIAAGRGYILADESGRYRPEEWARRAISLFDMFDADCIVAETNQGGDMVKATITAAARGRVVPYKAVTATRGKQVRAEPIAALYEQGKVRHAERFPQLEDQMCTFTLGFDRKEKGFSPDRLDAAVWALTELFPNLTMKKLPLAPIAPPPMSNSFANR